MSIRLNIRNAVDPAMLADARAELADARADLIAARMTRAFDVFTWYAVGVAVILAAFLVLTAIGGRPSPSVAPCGYVVEGAEAVPASCANLAELDARLDAIYAERSNGRFAPAVARSDGGK